MFEELKKQLIEDEGLCLRPYKCPAGKLTIGVGRNIEDNGVTKEEALYLLENDIKRTGKELESNIAGWHELTPARREVLINMCFNMGWPTLRKFKNMLAALAAGDFEKASVEMLDSRWAKQVGKRAKRLSETMRQGA